MGTPIAVEKNENPSVEEVEALHKKYIDSLVQIFEENKCRFGCSEGAKLVIH